MFIIPIFVKDQNVRVKRTKMSRKKLFLIINHSMLEIHYVKRIGCTATMTVISREKRIW